MLSSLLTPIRPSRAARLLVAVFPATMAILACDRSPTSTTDGVSPPTRASIDVAQANVVAPVVVEILSRAAFTDDRLGDSQFWSGR